MSKRQILVTNNNIEQYLAKKQKLSFITKSGSVFFAEPLLIKSEILKIKNTRGKKMDLPLSEIKEIWAEEVVTE
ncbi:MAG: hypothetical protein JXR03_13945 [Cyclobacteriaceae bacterium]